MNRRYGKLNRAFVNSSSGCGSYTKNVDPSIVNWLNVCLEDDTKTFTSEFHLNCFIIIIEKIDALRTF